VAQDLATYISDEKADYVEALVNMRFENILQELLAREFWPWVKSGRKPWSVRAHFGSNSNIWYHLWYWTIVYMFVDWKLYVTEKYSQSGIEAINAKRGNIYDPYLDDSILENPQSAASVAAFQQYEQQRQALDKEGAALLRETSAWNNLPNNQLKLLRWFLHWQGLHLSSDQIKEHLAPLYLGFKLSK
jgi:hypothetical protein